MKSTTRLIAAVIATLVLSGAAIGGVVFAQTASPTTSPSPATSPANPGGQQTQPSTSGQTPSNPNTAARQNMANDFLNQLAQNLGVSRSTLDSALKSAANTEVDKAVANGTLTQTQATAIKQRIANGQVPVGFGRFGGFGGPHGPRGKGLGGVDLRGAVANALGISTSELQQDLKNGQSIAQIAQAHGKTTQDLQNAVVASVKSNLDNQVKAGALTQTQENDILQKLQSGFQQRNGILGGGRRPRAAGSMPTPTPGSGQ
jgi:lambda repressor-like predicted transcriptional regulator